MPYISIVDAMLVLKNHDQVLSALRQGTGYYDGAYNVPSGRLEDGETILDAFVREAREEFAAAVCLPGD